MSHAPLLLLLAMHGYEGRSAASGMAEERDKVDGGSNARATDLLKWMGYERIHSVLALVGRGGLGNHGIQTDVHL